MGTKISELSQITSVATTDLILIAQDLGGSFASKKVDAKDISKFMNVSNVCSKTTNYTVAIDDEIILVSTGAAISLHASSGSGHTITIKNISPSYASDIVPNLTDNIDGINASVNVGAYTSTTLVDATLGNWYII